MNKVHFLLCNQTSWLITPKKACQTTVQPVKDAQLGTMPDSDRFAALSAAGVTACGITNSIAEAVSTKVDHRF